MRFNNGDPILPPADSPAGRALARGEQVGGQSWGRRYMDPSDWVSDAEKAVEAAAVEAAAQAAELVEPASLGVQGDLDPGSRGDYGTTDYRTASKADVAAALNKLGVERSW
jgi:hypothetical protein